MLVIPGWALAAQVFTGTGADDAWIAQERWLLVTIGLATLALEAWMVIEAILLWRRATPPTGPEASTMSVPEDRWQSG